MWKTVKLGDALSIARGGSPRPIKTFITEADDGINWIKIGDTNQGGRYIESTKEKIKPSGVSRSRYVKSGNFLLSNSMSFGRPYILKIDGCIHDGWLVLSDYEEIFAADYLYYLLSSPVVQSQFENLARGSTVRNLNIELVSSVVVSVPPLAEQQRIVAKLDSAFAEIDENMKILKFKQDNVKNLQSSLLSSSLDVDDNVWKTSRLGDVIENGETTNPTINPDTLFSYIDISSIDRSSFRIAQTHTLLGKDAPSRARRLVRKGDVLFATTRPTLQRIAIISEDLDKEVCSTGFIVLRPTVNLICSKFIFYFMLSEKVNKQMEELQTGASYPAVNDTQVKNLCISFPPLAKQERIVTKLDTAYIEFKNVNESIAKSIANYQALKSAILFQELQSSEAA